MPPPEFLLPDLKVFRRCKRGAIKVLGVQGFWSAWPQQPKRMSVVVGRKNICGLAKKHFKYCTWARSLPRILGSTGGVVRSIAPPLLFSLKGTAGSDTPSAKKYETFRTCVPVKHLEPVSLDKDFGLFHFLQNIYTYLHFLSWFAAMPPAPGVCKQLPESVLSGVDNQQQLIFFFPHNSITPGGAWSFSLFYREMISVSLKASTSPSWGSTSHPLDIRIHLFPSSLCARNTSVCPSCPPPTTPAGAAGASGTS